MKQFEVAIFEHRKKRSISLLAYTRYYNPTWEGCCLHRVEAESGTEAKARAMRDHRQYHMKEPEHRCVECGYPVAAPGLCGECSGEADGAI